MRERANHLTDLALSDTGFVFDPYSGATFTVNPSGLTLIRGLQAGSGRSELVEMLTDTYQVREQADLHRDVDEFVQMLKHEQLLPADFTLDESGS